jgi:peptidoglycan/LPS O-acetylase OafA/YrhL
MTAVIQAGASGKRIPELDGIRGIAIGMVLIHHYFTQPIEAPIRTFWSYFQACGRLSWSGVDLFFVLSGLLIGGILLDARNSTNYFQVFYRRRALRIVPIYLLCLVLAFLLSGASRVGLTNDFQWIFREKLPWFSYLVFLQNFWMAAATSFGAAVLAVTWSLAVEEQFYLTLPAIIRFLSRRRLALAVGGGIVLAPACRTILFAFARSHYVSWYVLLPCRADALLLGVAGAMALRSEAWKKRLSERRGALLLTLALLACGVIALTLRAPNPYGFEMVTVGYTWLGAFYLCLILCGLVYAETWFGKCLRWGWLRWLGSIAYGTYLFHILVLQVLRSVTWSGRPGRWTPWEQVTAVVALGITLVGCWISWIYFEKPLIKLGHQAKYEEDSKTGEELAALKIGTLERFRTEWMR